MSARADRRAILAGFAGCVAAGAIGAVTGSATARAAAERAEQSIDDRRILELAAEFEQIERRRLSLFSGPGQIADDDERDAAIEPLDAQQATIVDQLAALTPSSVLALGAVAACVLLWEGDQVPDPADSDEFVNNRLYSWIAQNVARLAGRTA